MASQDPPLSNGTHHEDSRPLKIIVVGAGIAGLSAAIGLRRAGHNVEVLLDSFSL